MPSPSLSPTIHPISQHLGGLEDHHFPWSQHQPLAGLRISSYPCIFTSHGELPKPADHDLFTVYQRSLHNFQQGCNGVRTFSLRKVQFFVHGINDVILCQCHCLLPLSEWGSCDAARSSLAMVIIQPGIVWHAKQAQETSRQRWVNWPISDQNQRINPLK